MPIDLEQELDAYEPDKFDYVVVTHRRVAAKSKEGFDAVGLVPDATSNDSGTMVVMAKEKK
jgi:hypothetical protein